MLDVVAGICGLHAQLLSSAELALWARIDDLEAPAAEQTALWEDRSLVKTWAMRGTLHLLPARELPLWVAAQGTRRLYLAPAWLRAFGVSRDELEALLAAVHQALGVGTLTREEPAGRVGELTGSAELGGKLRESWGALLKPAAFRGQLCFAPSLGQLVRFTRPDRWVPGWREEDAERSLVEVTRRYLAANGPATRDDYARWWAGTRAWVLAGDVPELGAVPTLRSVRLLPAFDQYVVAATRHADHLLAAAWRASGATSAGRSDSVWTSSPSCPWCPGCAGRRRSRLSAWRHSWEPASSSPGRGSQASDE